MTKYCSDQTKSGCIWYTIWKNPVLARPKTLEWVGASLMDQMRYFLCINNLLKKLQIMGISNCHCETQPEYMKAFQSILERSVKLFIRLHAALLVWCKHNMICLIVMISLGVLIKLGCFQIVVLVGLEHCRIQKKKKIIVPKYEFMPSGPSLLAYNSCQV